MYIYIYIYIYIFVPFSRRSTTNEANTKNAKLQRAIFICIYMYICQAKHGKLERTGNWKAWPCAAKRLARIERHGRMMALCSKALWQDRRAWPCAAKRLGKFDRPAQQHGPASATATVSASASASASAFVFLFVFVFMCLCVCLC